MVTRKVFEKYQEIQESGEMNMWSQMVEFNTGISREDHLDIIKNYKEIFDRYVNNIVIINDKRCMIEANFNSIERCEMEGYVHVKDDIYVLPNTTFAAIVGNYY